MRKEEVEKIIFNGMMALAIFLLVLSYIEKNLKIGIMTMGYLFFLYSGKKVMILYKYFKNLYKKNKDVYIGRWNK